MPKEAAKELSLRTVAEGLRTQSFGRWLLYRSRIGSTQNLARAAAAAGAPQGLAVLANSQTAGRGRLGRAWVSPAGASIHLSLVLRPTPPQLRQLTVMAPLAVALAIEETTALSPRVKWPNDLLLGGRKFAGVLIDSELAGDQIEYAIVGIGINVNLDTRAYPEIADIATSLMLETAAPPSREALLACLLAHLEALYVEAGRGRDVHRGWRERLDTLGRHVRARFGAQVEEGVAVDVDTDGSLIIRRDDGSRVTIAAGEVTLRGS